MVYIKKITMKGFKSYGSRKVSVHFPKGFTCIVGPNGSGKSNIIDALSFVLGRLSTKSLRAGVLSDLIFGGTKKMKEAKYAEVSIYFDNSNNEFPIDRKEVVISRSVDLSGKSVYRVNRKRETRTYVVDLLSQVGIFPEGHNIVMQGDITKFIKMSSWERRGIIEEISGIAEYNEKKARSERELQKANENIARVELLIGEVKTRLERLEKEKNDAIRYQQLKEEIYRCKGLLVYGELKASIKKMESLEKKIHEKTEKKKKNEEEISKLSEKIHETEEMVSILNSEIEKLGEEKHISITRDIEELKGKLNILKNELSFNQKRKGEIENNLRVSEAELKSSKARIIEIEAKIQDLEGEKKDLEIKIEEKSKKYREILKSMENEEILKLKEELEKINMTLDEKKSCYYELGVEIERLKGETLHLSEKKSEISLEDLREKKREILHLKNFLENKKREKIDSLEKVKNSIEKLESERKIMEKEISKVEDELWRKNQRLSQLMARINAKREAEKLFKGKRSAVSEILNSGIQGVHGVIADLGKTKKIYSIALEVAAGLRLNNIVVEDDEVARQCVSHLKKKRIGRATFLPLKNLEVRPVRREVLSILSKDGVVDLAINLVKFDEKFRKAFEYVFSDTVVVENLDVTKKYKNIRFVTLDGDLVEKSGSITGGYYYKKSYSLSFDIEEEEREVEEVKKRIGDLESTRKMLKEKIFLLMKNLRELENSKVELETEIPQISKEISEALEEEKRFSKELLILEEKTVEIDEKIQKNNALLEKNQKNYLELEREVKNLEKIKKETEEKLVGGTETGFERIEEDLKILRNLRGEIEVRIERLKSNLEFLNRNVEKLEREILENRDKVKKIDERISSTEKEISKFEKDLDEKLAEEEEFATNLSEKKEKRDYLRRELQKARNFREKLQKEIYKLESGIEFLNQQKEQLQNLIKELEEESKSYVVEGEIKDLMELKFRIKRMEAEREGLEPINMRAVEEYDEVEERYISLKTRIEKLYDERKSILDFIEEVESQKKNVFMKCFDKINKNFSRIFEELSGGEAFLVVDQEDPFEAGLDIVANPAGKELKRVEAMSGGEKALTALAFLFAIQAFKPAPFYMFDEIDAHLDDPNCKKVAEMIKRASEKTQFIVITLRDIMMAEAQVLYGVTMKDGISKIVSVELEKISEYIEPLPLI